MREILYKIYRYIYRNIKYLAEYLFKMLSPQEREFKRVWPLIEKIEGHLKSPKQEHWFFKAAKSLPDGVNIVEIGSFKGRSTVSFGYGCRGTKKHIYAIDTFNGNDVDFADRDYYEEFASNIKTCGLMNYVTPVQGLSSDVGKTWNKSIHLLYIDGSHQYEDALADFKYFFPHVEKNGIVAFHDANESWPGVLRVWKEEAIPRLVDIGKTSTLFYGRKR